MNISVHTINKHVPVEVPDEREYEHAEDANLDRALVEAIDAAEAADNSFLRRLLALELASHYHETR